MDYAHWFPPPPLLLYIYSPYSHQHTDQHKRLHILRNEHFGEVLCLCVMGVFRAVAYVSADKETAMHRFDQQYGHSTLSKKWGGGGRGGAKKKCRCFVPIIDQLREGGFPERVLLVIPIIMSNQEAGSDHLRVSRGRVVRDCVFMHALMRDGEREGYIRFIRVVLVWPRQWDNGSQQSQRLERRQGRGGSLGREGGREETSEGNET
jgi:hypothetical protein